MLTESRRKKTRNWEEEDYYDSDEDNFLDRTGTIERKRERRMKLAGKCEEKVETYNSLVILFHYVYINLCNISCTNLCEMQIFFFRLKSIAKLWIRFCI